ncbi:MAG TPA: TonB-dependent receptor [Longimicrobiales bacterium]|nr:TonB-dependent receptor [Longimicrobiales bacterium]
MRFPRSPAARATVVALLCLLAAGSTLAAQQATGRVQGVVRVQGTQRPLAGAQVFVPGTGLGALTDASGRYALDRVPAGSAALRVQMLGYAQADRTVQVTAGATATADFELEEAAVTLNEVVVTATGATRKREIGNSVSAINAQEIQRAPVRNAQDILAGRATGVNVLANSGQPGAGGSIRLRGNNSVTQGNNPIIYVDGVRIYNGATPTNVYARQASSPLNDIDPADIDRIEVVKGPAATTLYGTEASGGVIQIFTKRGMSGAPSWTAEVSGGFNNMGHIGPKEDPTGMWLNQCRGDGLVTGNGVRFEDPTCPESGTWLRNGPIQKYSLSVRGGTPDVTYFLSGNYGDEEGVLPTSGSKDGGFRGNFSFHPAKTVQVGLNSSYSKRNTSWIPDGNNASGVMLNVTRGPDSNFKGSGCSNPDVVCVNNAEIFKSESHTITDHFVTGFTVDYLPSDRFRNKLSVGYDYNQADITTVLPFGFLRLPSGQMYWNGWNRTLITVDLASSYRKDFGSDFVSTTSAGGQLFDSRLNNTAVTATNFSGPGKPTLTSAALRDVTDDDRTRVVNAGFFGQEQIAWKDRLFVTAGLRVDGNSAFGESFGLQPYPKLSASYVLSDYDWWPKSTIETFKLRGAVGESGKAPGAFDAVRTWQPIAGEDGQPAFTPGQIGNADLGPERTRETEAGFEGSALGGRVGVDFTYYKQHTFDALIAVSYAPSDGFLTNQLENVGELQNTGIEARLDLQFLRKSNLEWSGHLNFSTVNSKALDLGGRIITLGSLARTYVQEGYPVPSYFGKKVMNPDEVADPVIEDGQYLGSAFPTKTVAPSTSITLFRRLTLDALGEWQLGGHLLNAVAYQNANKGEWYGCVDVQKKMKAGKTDPSALAGVTALQRARCTTDGTIRDYAFWVEPTNFFKLRSVSLSYDLPGRLIPGARAATLTVAGRNLFKSTGYTGTDPEVADARDYTFARRDYYNFPTSRSFLATLRVSF